MFQLLTLTGEVAASDLYIACGNSGVIQQLADTKALEVILAINKDEEFLILQVANLGLVADRFYSVPELTAS